jgi:hypothetical protein
MLTITPKSAITLTINQADIIATPLLTTDFFGGVIGGDKGMGTTTGIDWSIGNCQPFAMPTDDMVFSTCIGIFTEAENWIEWMRITKAGNVGIGTSEPQEKLSVAGIIESTEGGIKFPDGTIQYTATLEGPE